jgi:hypothetical protein
MAVQIAHTQYDPPPLEPFLSTPMADRDKGRRRGGREEGRERGAEGERKGGRVTGERRETLSGRCQEYASVTPHSTDSLSLTWP